ncbi:glycerophosphodiester phosphodiesterase family protein [Caldicellulosiruptoraceae bacterium PP1]
MKKDLNWLLDKPIAHRGLHNNNIECPENSIEAFRKAIKYGYPIELDVRITKDNQVIVFHDNSLKRLVGIDNIIENSTYDELSKYSLYNDINFNHKIPLLNEVLELVAGSVPLLIEIKNEGDVGSLEENLLKILKNYKGKYAIQSFNPLSLLWFKKQDPDIIIGQLACDIIEDENIWFNTIETLDFISYGFWHIPDKLMNKIKIHNIPLLGWTIKSEEDEKIARQYCDNIIFEGYLPKELGV